ncbi:MAG TPA: glycoside hydrolase family 3 C-terminal domain-containing protein, partial [Dongiaceae bacterium]|nr:glycoside hydrolase family 3 C-terminal domain-containing protein [Dongiaceae bacterium]
MLTLGLLYTGAAASLLCLSSFAAEEVSCACNNKVVVIGQFEHRPFDTFLIAGAAGNEVAFKDEIKGPDFSCSVPELKPGKYTVEIGLAELEFDRPGQRSFDILCGDKALATNLDLFVAAGGVDKVLRIRGDIDFAGDAAHGPLTVRFVAKLGLAKLCTLEVRDANGATVAYMKVADLITGVDPASLAPPLVEGPVLWNDPSRPLEVRVRDLVKRMSLAEKASQMRNTAPAIPRLGLPAYNYWNECLHGVARSGVATVFPQAIGLAATWDPLLLHDMADAISTEARAKHHEYARAHNGDSAKYFGLTFWTPNMNIFRDPRWGRGQETYGEDPFLTARMAVAFITGLQGDDPKYAKAMACAKHFAVHSGPESTRHTFDAVVPERDFYETYLPHFEAAVREGKVWSVMGAYNSVYGEPACSSTSLLSDLLRKQWGFRGHVVSDCGAIFDIFANHKRVPTDEEGSARAVKAGCDMCCGDDYSTLPKAVRQGLVTEAEMDVALGRLLASRFRLGLFDPPEQVAYARIPFAANDTDEHHTLALRAARESMVLLKNNGVLPLNRARLKRLAVIGTNACSVDMMLGNYSGTPSKPVTILDGIKAAAGPGIEVIYEPGCPLAVRKDAPANPSPASFAAAMRAAASADVVIYVGGLNPQLEGEEMPVDYFGFGGGDRTDIELPAVQEALLKALHATGKPVVFVNCSGSAVAMVWAAEHLPAILQAWYPGGQGGQAVAETLFGDANPAGRLPVTFYRSTADLPPFEDYRMSHRTYRYFTGKPLFAFGHGLGYTEFALTGAKLGSARVGRSDSVRLAVDVKNSGQRDGDEVVQVYFRHVKPSQPQARLALCAFTRVNVPAGKTAPVSLEIPVERFRFWDTATKSYAVEPG